MISFFQDEPVSEKNQGRTIKVGFYNKTGELISDTFEINFDSKLYYVINCLLKTIIDY